MKRKQPKLPAPSFIQAFGDQCEARFENGADTVSLYLHKGTETGKIFASRPRYTYRSWEPGPENVNAYQRLALKEFTSGFAQIEIDWQGDAYALPITIAA